MPALWTEYDSGSIWEAADWEEEGIGSFETRGKESEIGQGLWIETANWQEKGGFCNQVGELFPNDTAYSSAA